MKKIIENRVESLPVDSEGKPVIVGCPATGCMELDPWIMECAGGVSYVTVCDSGHMAFVVKKED